MYYIKNVLNVLTRDELKKLAILMLMVVIMAILDTVGVASVLPLTTLVINPEVIKTNKFFLASYSYFGFADEKQFLVWFGSLLLALMVFSLVFKTITNYKQIQFALVREFSISKRLLEGYLRQPYEWFLNQHGAELGKTILSEAGVAVHQGILPLLTLIAQSVATIALVCMLVYMDPKLAFIVFIVLGAVYVGIFKLTKRLLFTLGKNCVKANKDRFKVVNEAFGAIKEIKLSGLERLYASRFEGPAFRYAEDQATAQIVGQIPRYLIECIALGGILSVVLYLMIESKNFAEALPMLCLYVFAGYRLMPALQQIYGSLTQLRFSQVVLKSLRAELNSYHSTCNPQEILSAIKLNSCIEIQNISYAYPNSERLVLNNVSLTIPAKKSIGIVGMSGCGKTTTIDIILGLLEPQCGHVKIDGIAIDNKNRMGWQKTLGYVPQHIFISDDTIASNIAFSVDSKDLDHSAIVRAAKAANIDHIIMEMPDGYNTKVGERGVRLSGGQRQRIGIARAIYHEPSVLILDEATSALDVMTEDAVVDAIKNLSDKMTIIIVAHKLRTVENCDLIFEFDSGGVIMYSSFGEFANKSRLFMQTNREYKNAIDEI